MRVRVDDDNIQFTTFHFLFCFLNRLIFGRLVVFFFKLSSHECVAHDNVTKTKECVCDFFHSVFDQSDNKKTKIFRERERERENEKK